MHVGFVRSRVPELVAGSYGLIFAAAVVLDLTTGGAEPWGSIVFLMTFPWSMLLLFIAAWSLMHSGHPLDYYFIPGALINMVAIFLIARSAIRRPGSTGK